MKQNKHYIIAHCRLQEGKLFKDGKEVFEASSKDFSTFSKELYKFQHSKYPKFFKMDRLSKLAFLAAEAILGTPPANPSKENDIALVFSNRASSLDTDRKHQNSIENKENYYPSPSVFVYTLPNICLGEISIRHKLYSENSFFIFEAFNANHLHTYAEQLLATNNAEKVLCGWVELDGDTYNAFVYLVGKEEQKHKHTVDTVETLYHTL